MDEMPVMSPEVRADRRAKYVTGLLWHIGTFVIVNAMFWLIDAWRGPITWAYLITTAWGVALAFHVLAYLIDGRQVEHHKRQDYLRQEQADHHQVS